MIVNTSDFERVESHDEFPDLSWLGEFSDRPAEHSIEHNGGRGEYKYFNLGLGDPDYLQQDYERVLAYNRSDWSMMGVQAEVKLLIPMAEGYSVYQVISSPGLWGLESDMGEDEFAQVFQEEKAVLAAMLSALGIEVVNDDS